MSVSYMLSAESGGGFYLLERFVNGLFTWSLVWRCRCAKKRSNVWLGGSVCGMMMLDEEGDIRGEDCLPFILMRHHRAQQK
jgi:hypothetical protein